jgi:phasin family protein
MPAVRQLKEPFAMTTIPPKQKGKAAMKDTVDAFSAGAEATQKNYERLFGATKEQLEKASVTAFKSYEDLSKFSKENVDAYVTAATTMAKGFETIGKAWVSFTQETMEASAQVAKSLLTAKTLREAVDVQTDFAKTTFDKMVSEGTKVSEISVKTANEAAEPINARVNAAIEKLLKPVAA